MPARRNKGNTHVKARQGKVGQQREGKKKKGQAVHNASEICRFVCEFGDIRVEELKKSEENY